MPLVIRDGKVIKTRAPKNQKPSIKQIKALQNIANGMSKRQAMLKAGYSKNVATTRSYLFLKNLGVRNAIQTIIDQLEKKGMDSNFYTDKIVEFANATKIHTSHTEPDTVVPDYSTQIQGIKLYEKLREQVTSQGNPIKRKITFEEFVTGKEDVK